MPTVIDFSVSKLIRQRYQRCPSDTEILFVIGMYKYAAFAGNRFLEENKEAVKSCVTFLESKLDEHRLIPGMDWRDTMPVYIRQVSSCKPDASSRHVRIAGKLCGVEFS